MGKRLSFAVSSGRRRRRRRGWNQDEKKTACFTRLARQTDRQTGYTSIACMLQAGKSYSRPAQLASAAENGVQKESRSTTNRSDSSVQRNRTRRQYYFARFCQHEKASAQTRLVLRHSPASACARHWKMGRHGRG